MSRLRGGSHPIEQKFDRSRLATSRRDRVCVIDFGANIVIDFGADKAHYRPAQITTIETPAQCGRPCITGCRSAFPFYL
jgi:hypothetical protein